MIKVTPERITSLAPNQIFVFGSNLAGHHGAGAAYDALTLFGAVRGVGIGPTGAAYAIPTKSRLLQTLTTRAISRYVNQFIEYAGTNPNLEFLITPIGCGLAGHAPESVAPLFAAALSLPNVTFPQSFLNVLQNQRQPND